MSYFPYVLQGDSEGACIHELETASEITGFSGGAPRISGDLVDYRAKARFVMVSREGGNTGDLTVDKPRIDFQCFAETRTVAHDLAQVVLAVMFRAIGNKYAAPINVQIADVKVETGIFRVPDKETGSPRYVLSLRLTCVPI